MKTKSPNDIVLDFRSVLDEFRKKFPNKVIFVTTDNGNEWLRSVKKLFDDMHVKLWIANPYKLRNSIDH